jgi:hypothetical protein
LVVVLTDEFAPGRLTAKTDFLSLKGVERLPNGFARHYTQREDYTTWSGLSTTLLGEIRIDGPAASSSLCVVLGCSADCPRPGLLTAVSPSGQSLKIEPQQTLQVVVADDDQAWDWMAMHHSGWLIEAAGNAGLAREQAQYCPSAERHYYFRYHRSTVEQMRTLAEGLYPGGSVTLFKGTVRCDLNLMLSVRSAPRPVAVPRLANPYITPLNKHRRAPPGPFVSTVRITEKENSTLDSDCRVYVT